MSQRDLVYFNNATTSFPKSTVSLQAYLDAIRRPPMDSRHSSIAEADVEIARRSIAATIGCASDEVFFSSDATSGINQILRGYLNPGDFCVVDNRTHNAVTRTLHGMSSVAWHVMALMNVEDDVELAAIDPLASMTPALFCISHASNVTGSIYDVGEVLSAIRAQSPDSAVFVDASQSAGYAALEVLAGADFAVFPSHKHLHAPAGAAVVMARRPVRQFMFGGTGKRSADLETRVGAGNMTEVGTPNGAAILALVAALEAEKAERVTQARICEAVVRRLWDGLTSIKGLRLYGRNPDGPRTCTVSFSSGGIDPEGVWMPYLRSRQIVARGGLHCCPLFHEQMGLLSTGTLRLSPSSYSTAEEIDHVVSAIDELVRAFDGADYR